MNVVVMVGEGGGDGGSAEKWYWPSLPAQHPHWTKRVHLCQEVKLDLIKAACVMSVIPP